MFTLRAAQQHILAQEGLDRLKSDALSTLRNSYPESLHGSDVAKDNAALDAALADVKRLRLQLRENALAYLVLALRFRTSLAKLRAHPVTGGILRNDSLTETEKIYLLDETLSQS